MVSVRAIRESSGMPYRGLSHSREQIGARILDGAPLRVFVSSANGRNSVEDSGNRLLTALGYLCDLPSPSSGGATRFTKLGFQVEPELGKLLVFHNCYAAQNADLVAFKTPNADDDGFHCRRIAKRHPLSEHEGMTVHEGEKLAFNLWFREQDTKSGFAST
eukprot:SAG31_NODE_469_length_15244_cov_11.537141_4_plen_161_part_00